MSRDHHDYDADAIRRFIEIAGSRPYETPDDEAIKEAASFLWNTIYDVKKGHDPKRAFSSIGVKKVRTSKFNAEHAAIDTPEFEVVRRLVNNQLSYSEAKKHFQELRPASERQIENWIATIRPRAERVNRFLKTISGEASDET